MAASTFGFGLAIRKQRTALRKMGKPIATKILGALHITQENPQVVLWVLCATGDSTVATIFRMITIWHTPTQVVHGQIRELSMLMPWPSEFPPNRTPSKAVKALHFRRK